MRSTIRLVLSAATLLYCSVAAAERKRDDAVHFHRDVRPILAQNCFQCHGPAEANREADLRLDLEDGIRQAFEGGSLEDSEGWRRITAEDEDERMPPVDSHLQLEKDQISVIEKWIIQGAQWQGHWSFITPIKPPVPGLASTPSASDPGATSPAVNNVILNNTIVNNATVNNVIVNNTIVNNAIDAFIDARLETEKLVPNPEADRERLLRRVTFDLTGAPPTIEQMDAFLADRSENAYEKVVDRLLASPRFGERMALAWMDLARYGDTSVFHADGPRDMWLWREWVIRAYNANKSFDQFTIEQLAGDLLPEPTIEQRVATGFNRNNATTDEGGAIEEEFRVEYAVDRVKTTSMVWLGLTLECSQCHEHKYDPISQEEYYQFFAYFNQSADGGLQTRGGNAAPLVAVPNQQASRQLAALEKKISGVQQRFERATEFQQRDQRRWEQELKSDKKAFVLTSGPWHALGPIRAKNRSEAFELDFGVERIPDLDKPVGQYRWKERSDLKDGGVHNLADGKNDVHYFARKLTATQAGVVRLSLGSDDAIKLWVNGKKVLANDVGRAAAADQDQLNVDVEEGENTILAKVINYGGRGGFYFNIGQGIVPGDILTLINKEDSQRDETEQKKLQDYFVKNSWRRGRLLTGELQELQAQKKKIKDTQQTVMVMQDVAKPRDTYLLMRGDYASPQKDKPLRPGVPAVLPPIDSDAPPNRLGLAEWLVRSDNPLTPRVAMNRYWHMFFGIGLVKTLEDFGSQGDWPTHPELLDWLAADFVESGWNIKRAIKQMMMSATYRRSSRASPALLQRDPENRLLARGPRFRLQGEFIRDNALAASGLLVGTIGGPSVKPYQPPGLWNEVSIDTGLRFTQDHGDKVYRRSMYIYWKRSAPAPSMTIFGTPSRETCTVRRARTNTPLQALVTLNDQQFVEAARSLAQRVMQHDDWSLERKITTAYRLVTGVRPNEKIRTTLLDTYQQELAVFQQQPERAQQLLAIGESKRDERLDLVQHAALTIVASVILNLDQALTRG